MKLAQWMEEKGYRDDYVAKKIGITTRYFKELKAGRHKNPSLLLITSIENFTNCGVTIKDLIIQKEEKGEEEKKQG